MVAAGFDVPDGVKAQPARRRLVRARVERRRLICVIMINLIDKV